MTISRQNNFDIFTYPENPDIAAGHKRVALGDGHGNFIKLLAFLIKKNVITNTTPLQQSEYEELVRIYKKCFRARMKNDELPRLLTLINNFEKTASTDKTSVLHIGDDLADRGGSDIGTLLIYLRLAALNVDYTILASNHGLDFLQQFFSPGGLMGPVVSEYMLARMDGMPENYFGRSLKALRDHIGGIDDEKAARYMDGLQTDEEQSAGQKEALADINQIVETNYIKHLKLLAYDFKDGGIILYSHAPKDPAEIVQLYNELKYALNDMVSEFSAATPEEFAVSIDQMNKWFQEVLTKPHLFQELMIHGKPLKTFVNTRYAELEQFKDDSGIELFGTYLVTNVHGHVGEFEEFKGSIPTWVYVNLDNNLGRMMPDREHNNRGELKTYIADVNTLDFQYKEEQIPVMYASSDSDIEVYNPSSSSDDAVHDAFLEYKTQNAKDVSMRSESSLWSHGDKDKDKVVPPPRHQSKKP